MHEEDKSIRAAREPTFFNRDMAMPLVQSIVLTELGIAIMDGDRCIKSFPFASPAPDYVEAMSGRGIDELLEYIASAQESFVVSHESIYKALKTEAVYMRMMSEEELESVQDSKVQILVRASFVRDAGEATSRLRDFAMQLSSLKVARTSESPDLHVIQAIGALDEIDREINIAGARIREWYGLHFPELENMVDGIGNYARIVIVGKREGMSAEKLRKAGLQLESAEMLSTAAERSNGGGIAEEDLNMVQAMAGHIIEAHHLRTRVEAHVEDVMRREAPNVTAVLGASVGARMLARVGSLKRLAMMPSSAIQVLGAEKALFRSMRTGSHPPKHGLIFQHAMVHSAPRWQRGRIARAVAAKAAIAARVDMHRSGLNETLLEKLNIRVKEIGEKLAEPPEALPASRLQAPRRVDGRAHRSTARSRTGGGRRRTRKRVDRR